uniref:Uncharacterized protein n=1 Tax=Solanum tuberosum TaxID=4113 RepID=M1DUD7_SOLTU
MSVNAYSHHVRCALWFLEKFYEVWVVVWHAMGRYACIARLGFERATRIIHRRLSELPINSAIRLWCSSLPSCTSLQHHRALGHWATWYSFTELLGDAPTSPFFCRLDPFFQGSAHWNKRRTPSTSQEIMSGTERPKKEVTTSSHRKRVRSGGSNQALLGIGPVFHEPVDDDIPTDMERLCTRLDVESDSDEEVDPAKAGNEARGGEAMED